MKPETHEIEKIVVSSIQQATGIEMEIANDVSLIDGGILDSMSIVSLVQMLQSELNVELDFADITVENFDSVNALVPFLSERLSAA